MPVDIGNSEIQITIAEIINVSFGERDRLWSVIGFIILETVLCVLQQQIGFKRDQSLQGEVVKLFVVLVYRRETSLFVQGWVVLDEKVSNRVSAGNGSIKFLNSCNIHHTIKTS